VSGSEKVFSLLMNTTKEQIIVVNAENYDDLDKFTTAAIQAEKAGKKFLYRTAASFVKSITGISSVPLFLPPKPKKTGLVIAGSFVDKTTRQIEYLTEKLKTKPIVVQTNVIIKNFTEYRQEINREIEERLLFGEIPVVCTQRTFTRTGQSKTDKNLSSELSDFLCAVVSNISVSLNFIVAKGGITSFEIAKNALGINSALVEGQIIKGVPVWKANTKFGNDLLYVVFPGNVGEDESLYQVVSNLIS
jgi:uncharacterized protein YgbK (DUF1537 family)